MTGPAADRGWRAQAAAEAFGRYIETAPHEGPALVLCDPHPGAARALERSGLEVERWDRILRPGVAVGPWPPDGPFRTAALRLPRAGEELEMLVHAALSVLVPGGILLVYGANDEGARSAPARIDPLTGPVDTVMRKSRCRVLRTRRPERPEGLRGALEAWRSTFTLNVDGEERPWVSYPGVFAHGRLDPGTELLLHAVAALPSGARALDFGCGSGVIGGVLLGRTPGLDVELLDVDAIALEAAAENVPDARTLLTDGLPRTGDLPYDLIVSNPPYHEGKEESLAVVRSLVRDAPDRLARDGELVLVVQRRFPLRELLGERFGAVEVLAEDPTYRVWRAR